MNRLLHYVRNDGIMIINASLRVPIPTSTPGFMTAMIVLTLEVFTQFDRALD